MQNVIDIDELSERLRAVVRDVAARRVPYVLAENGRPEAAIVPIEDFRRLTEPGVNPLLAKLDRLEARLAPLAEDSAEVEKEIAAAVADGVPEIAAWLAAQRVFNARYDWGPRDSTEVLREIREG